MNAISPSSRPYPHRLRFIILLASLGVSVSAPAVVLTWDANPAISGAQNGNGTWNTSNNNWTNGVAT